MMFGWIIFIILIIYLFDWHPRERYERVYHPETRSALDILKERYARGEIEREDFLARKQELEL